MALNFLPGPILPLTSLTPLGDSPASVTRGQLCFLSLYYVHPKFRHQRGGTVKFIQGKQWTPNSQEDLRGWSFRKSMQGQLGSGLVEGPEDDLADLAGHGVEDQEEEDGDQGQQQQQHQDAPVPAPDEEDESLKWVHKPVEGSFRAAVGAGEKGMSECPESPCPPPPAPPAPPPPHLGLSKGSGSFRPFPTGRFSASSTVSSSNSASTFP